MIMSPLEEGGLRLRDKLTMKIICAKQLVLLINNEDLLLMSMLIAKYGPMTP